MTQWSIPEGLAQWYEAEELKFMVITEWSDAEKAKEASEKITQIREQASEEFENVMLSSHAGEVFASN